MNWESRENNAKCADHSAEVKGAVRAGNGEPDRVSDRVMGIGSLENVDAASAPIIPHAGRNENLLARRASEVAAKNPLLRVGLTRLNAARSKYKACRRGRIGVLDSFAVFAYCPTAGIRRTEVRHVWNASAAIGWLEHCVDRRL
jgi:hypothetical protein